MRNLQEACLCKVREANEWMGCFNMVDWISSMALHEMILKRFAEF